MAPKEVAAADGAAAAATGVEAAPNTDGARLLMGGKEAEGFLGSAIVRGEVAAAEAAAAAGFVAGAAAAAAPNTAGALLLIGGYDDPAGFFDCAAAVPAAPNVDGAVLLIGGYPAALAGAGAGEDAAAFAAPSPNTAGGFKLMGG